jgi:hypothetical protein
MMVGCDCGREIRKGNVGQKGEGEGHLTTAEVKATAYP